MNEQHQLISEQVAPSSLLPLMLPAHVHAMATGTPCCQPAWATGNATENRRQENSKAWVAWALNTHKLLPRPCAGHAACWAHQQATLDEAACMLLSAGTSETIIRCQMPAHVQVPAHACLNSCLIPKCVWWYRGYVSVVVE